MSDALQYLIKTRPEAMQAYFSFLKQNGRHLDPKTRALISVLTKVLNQTETGLRQYLPKALAAGASPNEVLDALLMAFPALGLTKIVWAIDVIIDMGLPEFQLDNMLGQQVWMDLGPVKDFQEGVNPCSCNDRDVWVVKSGNDLSVYDSRCPHQGTYIPDGCRDGVLVRCPQHSWSFSLEDGRCLEGGDLPLAMLPTKLDRNHLWILDPTLAQ
jgi:nitrite reductase/ring-hydroxylating ferredoxin subunit/alkylhydroperoxidase/carboxymuconolactone decarboxylase family protein YurZ